MERKLTDKTHPRLGSYSELSDGLGKVVFRSAPRGGTQVASHDRRGHAAARLFEHYKANPLELRHGSAPTYAEACEAMRRLWPSGYQEESSDKVGLIIEVGAQHHAEGYARGYKFGVKDCSRESYAWRNYQEDEDEAARWLGEVAGEAGEMLRIVSAFLESLAADEN